MGAEGQGLSSEGQPRVLFIAEWIPEYRLGFFEEIAAEMATRGVRVDVVSGEPPSEIAARGDSRELAGTARRASRSLPVGGRRLIWQPWFGEARKADLVVVNEGSRFLLNYVLLLRQRMPGGAAVALWGHGANLDTLNSSRLAERVKRVLYRLPHWWFAYTEGSRSRLRGLGFPDDRITVAQNAPPTESLVADLSEIHQSDLEDLRAELEIPEGPTALFLGSLYATKRLDYLLAAADRIAETVPDFSLLIVGDGPLRDQVAAQVAQRPYARFLGRLDGTLKARALRAADLLLLPGAVGLSILDGFASGLPTVTTAIPTHGPEIEYLSHDRNGILLDADASPAAFARATSELLSDSAHLRELGEGATASGRAYTSSAMVQRFADGLQSALSGR